MPTVGQVPPGNMSPWWTDQDSVQFSARAQKLRKLPLFSLHLKARLCINTSSVSYSAANVLCHFTQLKQ